MHWHTAQYLARLAAPFLFLFACLTLILSSMQVGLAARPTGTDDQEDDNLEKGDAWDLFSRVSMWFAIIVVVCIIFMTCCAVIGFGIFIVHRVFVGMKENRAWLRGERLLDEEKNG